MFATHRACLLLVAVALPAAAFGQAEFAACVVRLERLAVERGVQAVTAERVLARVEPLERVIAADRNQPEFVDTFASYLGRRVTAERVATGRALYAEHRDLLGRLTREHGVPGHYLLAFWALETNYGRFLGNVPVFDALATLACDDRRSDYFAGELVNALRIADRGDVDDRAMVGSWAGAMGHTQFMPSAYLEHAADGDGDGKIDLWGSIPDALTSGARYLSALGWQTGERWGREVRLPEQFDYYLAGSGEGRELRAWRALGVTDVSGALVPDLDLAAELRLPAGHRGPAFVTYQNFETIMRWNRSEFFALTVGHLADRIAGGASLAVGAEEGTELTRTRLEAVQQALNERGYDSGDVDGRLGPATRRAIRDFQRAEGLPADGFPDPALLTALGVG
jgi:membrane-bound lytic murein transglycosylase B